MADAARSPSEPISRILARISRRGVLTVEWSRDDDVDLGRARQVPGRYIVAEDASARLDSHVSKTRKRLEGLPRRIRTVRGAAPH